MPACAGSTSRRRTLRTGSSRPDDSWRTASARRRSLTRTGGCSAARCGAWDEGSAGAAAPGEADRGVVGGRVRSLGRVIGERGGAEQLLHGEPHPGNLLTTQRGLFFIDLEACCRGPVEFDLAHAPEDVGEHYPGADPD